MQASKYCDYNVGLPHKASWHACITFAFLMIPASSSYMSALVSAKSHQSAAVLMPVPYSSQSAARMLSLQGVRLCQAALCQPNTESLFMAAVLAGHQCSCRSAQDGSTLVCKHLVIPY